MSDSIGFPYNSCRIWTWFDQIQSSSDEILALGNRSEFFLNPTKTDRKKNNFFVGFFVGFKKNFDRFPRARILIQDDRILSVWKPSDSIRWLIFDLGVLQDSCRTLMLCKILQKFCTPRSNQVQIHLRHIYTSLISHKLRLVDFCRSVFVRQIYVEIQKSLDSSKNMQ